LKPDNEIHLVNGNDFISIDSGNIPLLVETGSAPTVI
jgi:hypothetical protein